MGVVQFSAARSAGGQFAPGVSGNPAGRPKGSRNRSTLLMASLGEADAEAVVAAAVAKAKAGDGAMLRCLVTRILPAVRSRPVELEVPEGSETDLRALHDAILRGLAQGEILPDEALMIARALEKMAHALATAAAAASPSPRRRSRLSSRARKLRACKSPVSRSLATPPQPSWPDLIRPSTGSFSAETPASDGKGKEIGGMRGIEGSGGSDARSASLISSPQSPAIPQIPLPATAPSAREENPWMPGSSPGMTTEGSARERPAPENRLYPRLVPAGQA
jgi:Family of unknown function (DUF5681)